MLFLMNDVVLSFDANELTPPMTRDRFAKLSLNYVSELGRELFAAEPLLHHKDVEKVSRLAALMVLKAPDINAALFVAPGRGCRVADVQVRYARDRGHGHAAGAPEVWRPDQSRSRSAGLAATGRLTPSSGACVRFALTSRRTSSSN